MLLHGDSAQRSYIVLACKCKSVSLAVWIRLLGTFYKSKKLSWEKEKISLAIKDALKSSKKDKAKW